jgi:signal peptidase I
LAGLPSMFSSKIRLALRNPAKETIEIRDGQVVINGEPLVEPYEVVAPRYEMDKWSHGENEYFVLGDNRNNSPDSRIWGSIKWDQIPGRALPMNQ